MRRFRSVIAAVLLALWLPASLQCEMEWAGILSGLGNGCDRTSIPGQDSDADGCAIVEAGRVIVSPATAIVKNYEFGRMLLLDLSTDWIELTPSEPPPAPATAPPEIIRRWQFLERAAPLSRAPALIG
jgi:hypothetical protein